MRTTVGEAEFSSCLRNLPPALRSAYESAEGGSAAGGSDSSDPSTLEFGFVPARLTAALRRLETGRFARRPSWSCSNCSPD